MFSDTFLDSPSGLNCSSAHLTVTVSLFTHCLTSPGHSVLPMVRGASPLLTKSSIELCGVHRPSSITETTSNNDLERRDVASFHLNQLGLF